MHFARATDRNGLRGLFLDECACECPVAGGWPGESYHDSADDPGTCARCRVTRMRTCLSRLTARAWNRARYPAADVDRDSGRQRSPPPVIVAPNVLAPGRCGSEMNARMRSPEFLVEYGGEVRRPL